MKALTLTQPWASLVAVGEKRIETRSWSTNYRGELAIHAAAEFPAEAKRLCDGAVFANPLGKAMGWPGGRLSRLLPVGAVVATCRLVDCLPMVAWAPVAMCLGETRPVWAARLLTVDPPEILVRDHLEVPRVPAGDPDAEDLTDQIPFGDFTPGRFGWILEDITPLPEPIPVKGFQRLWEWNPAVVSS